MGTNDNNHERIISGLLTGYFMNREMSRKPGMDEHCGPEMRKPRGHLSWCRPAPKKPSRGAAQLYHTYYTLQVANWRCFCVLLHLAACSVSEDRIRILSNPEPKGLTVTTQGRTILIVDRDPSIVVMLDLALSEMGFVPSCAHSAREALDACAMQAPDLALIDIDVPGWVDLLTGLRRMNPLIRCCLVGAAGMTAHTLEDLQLLGAACFFSKPFTLQQLKAALE